MQSHWELFQEYYNQASEEQRNFVDQNVFLKIIEKSKLNISDEQKRDIIFATNLLTLGFEDINGLDSYLSSLMNNLNEMKNYIKSISFVYLKYSDYQKYGSISIGSDVRIKSKNIASKAQKYLLQHENSISELFSIAQKYNLHNDESYKKFAITVGDIILGFYRIEDTVPLLQQELGIDPRTAALLGADVLDFLAPLSDPNWQPPVEEDETENDYDTEETAEDQTVAGEPQATNSPPVDTSADQTPVAPPPVTNNQPHHTPFTPYPNVPPVTAPPATPAPTTSPYDAPNPALHTMAGDMQQVRQATPSLNLEESPTYVSQNQASLRQPLSDTPTYTPAPTSTTPVPPHNPEPPRWSSS